MEDRDPYPFGDLQETTKEDFLKLFRFPPDLYDSNYANFRAWEQLRWYYNGAAVLLSLPFLLFYIVTHLGDVSADLDTFLVGTVGIFLVINGGFCVGIVAENYVTWMGLDRMLARKILFGLGLLVLVGIACLCLA